MIPIARKGSPVSNGYLNVYGSIEAFNCAHIPSEFCYKLWVYLVNAKNPELVRGVLEDIRVTHSIWSRTWKHAKRQWTQDERGLSR
jgi:hypothetical protein